MIPADVFGAFAETTMADVELLGLMGGVRFPTGDGHVLAQTICGEQLTYAHHPILRQTVYYRSGRENFRQEILLPKPGSNLPWLYHRIESRRPTGLVSPDSLQKRYEKRPAAIRHQGSQPARPLTAIDIARAINQLARKRTIYDAQLQHHCGNAT